MRRGVSRLSSTKWAQLDTEQVRVWRDALRLAWTTSSFRHSQYLDRSSVSTSSPACIDTCGTARKLSSSLQPLSNRSAFRTSSYAYEESDQLPDRLIAHSVATHDLLHEPRKGGEKCNLEGNCPQRVKYIRGLATERQRRLIRDFLATHAWLTRTFQLAQDLFRRPTRDRPTF